MQEMPALECLESEDVDAHIEALDTAGADLQRELTLRVYDVVTAPSHLKAHILAIRCTKSYAHVC
jgi:hypothetical protein